MGCVVAKQRVPLIVIVLCVVEQHEGGVNPTESMTRALISDDSIARQSTLGPVQLGYVSFSTLFHTHSLTHLSQLHFIYLRCRFQIIKYTKSKILDQIRFNLSIILTLNK